MIPNSYLTNSESIFSSSYADQRVSFDCDSMKRGSQSYPLGFPEVTHARSSSVQLNNMEDTILGTVWGRKRIKLTSS